MNLSNCQNKQKDRTHQSHKCKPSHNTHPQNPKKKIVLHYKLTETNHLKQRTSTQSVRNRNRMYSKDKTIVKLYPKLNLFAKNKNINEENYQKKKSYISTWLQVKFIVFPERNKIVSKYSQLSKTQKAQKG